MKKKVAHPGFTPDELKRVLHDLYCPRSKTPKILVPCPHGFLMPVPRPPKPSPPKPRPRKRM